MNVLILSDQPVFWHAEYGTCWLRVTQYEDFSVTAETRWVK